MFAKTSVMSKVRHGLFDLLFEGEKPSAGYRFVNRAINIIIFASIAILALEQFEWIKKDYEHQFDSFNNVSVFIFTAEYVARLFCGGLEAQFKNRRFATLAYLVTPLAILDLVVILPFFIGFLVAIDLRILRLIRLLRVFKLAHTIVPEWKQFQTINEGRTLRQKVFSALNADAYSGHLHSTIDAALVGLICVSVVAVILESVVDIEVTFAAIFHYFDIFSVAIFSIEYALRFYSSAENEVGEGPITNRLHFATSASGIIDILAILPFYISFMIAVDLRFLRVMRLLRILKLTRYSTAMSTVVEVVEEEMPSLSAAFFVLVLITIFSASLLYLVEHGAQPDKFTSIPQAMYWAVITLTSIGYGDIYPITPLGQFLTMLMACVGLGMIALPTGILATGFTEKLRRRKEEFEKMVEQKAATGFISTAEQEELDRKARALGLSTIREKQIEQDELSTMGVIRTAETVNGLSLSFRSHDALEEIVTKIDFLSPHDKSVVMALLAVNMTNQSAAGEREDA